MEEPLAHHERSVVRLPVYSWLDQSQCFDAVVFETGWRGLIERLLAELDAVLKETKAEVEVRQIKEKLGALRVYYRLRRASARQADAIKILIARACDASLDTCIVCGGKGSFKNSDGRLEVVCLQHTKRGSSVSTSTS